MTKIQDNKGGLLVAENPCEHCLFSDSPIVGKARKVSIIKSCLRDDTHFLCHVPATQGDKTEVVCRGFYDRYTSQMIRIAGRMNMITFVDVEAKGTEDERS